VYLLKDGAKYAIVGDEIGDDELAEYAEGEPVGSTRLRGRAPLTRSVAIASYQERGVGLVWSTARVFTVPAHLTTSEDQVEWLPQQ
jgi:hypothetical protein